MTQNQKGTKNWEYRDVRTEISCCHQRAEGCSSESHCPEAEICAVPGAGRIIDSALILLLWTTTWIIPDCACLSPCAWPPVLAAACQGAAALLPAFCQCRGIFQAPGTGLWLWNFASSAFSNQKLTLSEVLQLHYQESASELRARISLPARVSQLSSPQLGTV